ncbi:MAG: hypothetical protein K5695_02225 [Oscillospiraceae bacterium]|nr:hypothetical protein [Oscillospiraceae bacterium]
MNETQQVAQIPADCDRDFLLDKRNTLCYNNKAASREQPHEREFEKVFEKSFEKGLTNDLKCGIINKLSQRTADREWKPGQAMATAS